MLIFFHIQEKHGDKRQLKETGDEEPGDEEININLNTKGILIKLPLGQLWSFESLIL